VDYVNRLRQLQEKMESRLFDGLIYGIGPNFRYFTGLSATWKREEEPERPDAILLLARAAEPRIIMDESHSEWVERAPVEVHLVKGQIEIVDILNKILPGRRIGIGPGPAAGYLRRMLQRVLPEPQVVSADSLGEEMRYRKSEDEIAVLRKAAVLCDQVMGEVVEYIRPGTSQTELEEMIAEFGCRAGAESVSFSPTAGYVKSDTEPTDDPFVYPKDDGLVPGTSIAFDFGFVVDGYCSDFGRSFYCGPAPDHIREAYRALQQSQLHLISRMKPGQLLLSELFDVAEEALDQRGYGDRLRARLPERSLGHQIGVDLHENPRLQPESDVTLQPGMVMAVEPKLWLPGEYYLRVEDIVLITNDEPEILTNYDRDTFELPVT